MSRPPGAPPRSPEHAMFPPHIRSAMQQSSRASQSSQASTPSANEVEFGTDGQKDSLSRSLSRPETGKSFNASSRPSSGHSFQKKLSATKTNSALHGATNDNEIRASSGDARKARGSRGGQLETLDALRSGGRFNDPASPSSVSFPSKSIPGSARFEDDTSKTSRSHAPSLAAHAFFRPMSSRRLQAQRSARLASRAPTGPRGAEQNNSNFSTRRNSIITDIAEAQDFSRSNLNLHDGRGTALPSQGTEYTRDDEQTTLDLDSATRTRSRNWSDSKRPLKHRESREGYVNGDSQVRKGPSNTKNRFPSLFSKSYSSYHDDTRLPHDSITHAKERNYQYFSGNTMFFARGRAQNTRDRPVNIITGCCVIVPAILFLVFSGPYLTREASAAIPFFFAYLAFICMSSFVHVSVTDPGILPRNLHKLAETEAEDPLTVTAPMTHWTMVKSSGSADAAMDVPTKYCKTCNIWRPPRCHHCRICDNCIETQDHHCVWVNNCIGRRNYRYFLSFVGTVSMLGVFLIFGSLGHCLRYASSQQVSFAQSINTNRVPFAMFIYGILATPYPVCLWGYHLWLTGRGETTREYLNGQKFLPRDRHRPFTQASIWKNWIFAFLRPRSPTYLRFKDEYVPGDQRYGTKRGKMPSVMTKSKRRSIGLELQDVRAPGVTHKV